MFAQHSRACRVVDDVLRSLSAPREENGLGGRGLTLYSLAKVRYVHAGEQPSPTGVRRPHHSRLTVGNQHRQTICRQHCAGNTALARHRRIRFGRLGWLRRQRIDVMDGNTVYLAHPDRGHTRGLNQTLTIGVDVTHRVADMIAQVETTIRRRAATAFGL